MSQLNHAPVDLAEWTFVKERGATARSGAVYRSPAGDLYLRTGSVQKIRDEAEFAVMALRQGFPVPEVMSLGVLPDGLGYFVEASAGDENFASLLGKEYAATGRINEPLFAAFSEVALQFFAAQLRTSNRQPGPVQLREGIQLENVLAENPDIDTDLADRFMAEVERRTSAMPLVLTHGDFTPFNIMTGGVIDFEERFIAPAGYDAVTCVTFQRLWDHPLPDGTGTMKNWEFSRRQLADYLSRADILCAEAGIPAISAFFDDFLALKAIWALCYERPEDIGSAQAARWQWRKRVALHCVDRYMAGLPIVSEAFSAVGHGSIGDVSI